MTLATARLLALVITVAINLLLAVFVYKNNSKSATNIIFGALAVVTTLWLADVYLSVDPRFFTHALLWVRLSIFFAIPQITLFFLLAHTIPSGKLQLSPRKLDALLVLTAALMLDAASSLAFTGVQVQATNVQALPGPGLPPFVLFALTVSALAVYVIYRKMRRARGYERAQYTFVFAGMVAMLGLLFSTVLVPVAIFHNNTFVPFAPLYTVIFLGATTYAIIRTHLFNIRAAVARSVAYVLLLLTLAGLYGVGIFAISRLFFPDSGSNMAQNAVYVVLAVVLAFTFQPLSRFFEYVTDSIFFRDRYDSQEVLNAIGNILVTEFKLDRLVHGTLKKLCDELKIASGQLYVFDEDRVYKVEHYGVLPSKLITVPHLQSLRHKVLVTDELPDGHEKDIMLEFGYRVVLHLDTKEEFVGYLLLGDKLSGDVYTVQDVELLEIAAQDLAVAISNAKAYEDIAQFNVTLQQKIDDATKKLKRANEDLKELDKAKDEFISMASHQLRTPLTSIKGYLSMVLEGDTGKINAQQHEFLDYAFTGTQRTVNLISDLLNVSRMTAGKFFIEKTDVDLNKLVAEEVQQLQQMADSRQLKLKFVPPKKPLPIMQLDEGKTRQVVMNFVDNALHYTKKGSVVVTLEQVGKKAELRVKDSGIGVPKDAQTHLFSKFFRADNAQTARPDGTGLGLFLAKRVVEDQGGTIIFETVEGKGSTFGFSMPLVTPKVPTPASPASTKPTKQPLGV